MGKDESILSLIEPNVPICVDLDGTLVKGDSSLKAGILLFRKYPVFGLKMLTYLLANHRAKAKDYISSKIDFNTDKLSYGSSLIQALRDQKAKNPDQEIILVTGSHQSIASQVQNKFPFFDEAFGSDDETNLISTSKAKLLILKYPEGFAYIGNSNADLNVWSVSKYIITANCSKSLQGKASRLGEYLGHFSDFG